MFRVGTKTSWVVWLLLTGVIGAFVYRHAGRPDVYSEVGYDESTDSFWCKRCGLRNLSGEDMDEHFAEHLAEDEDEASESPPDAYEPEEPKPFASALAARESKACPDCAEEVRYAARKCRFCGHIFESSS